MSERIIDAILNSQYSKLLLFMRHNYNFKIKSKIDNQNILMIALNIEEPRRRFKMLRFLLKQNLVDILDQDKNGHDIFFLCVIKELDTELSYLIKNYMTELNLSRTDLTGKTLLHYAVINNNTAILRIVLSAFAKYKINVDIPDKINKITPYLLACRLNYAEAAQMLLDIGHASKNQADQASFFDAEKWKKEGQVEILKNYLKLNEQEINNAKLNGKLRIFRQLKHLSNSLDYEVENNPQILPVIAQVLNNQRAKKIENKSIPIFRIKKSSTIQDDDRKSNLSRTRTLESSTFSSNTSSSFSNYLNSPCFSRSGYVLKPELNCLLEMTENSTRVNNYVSSKSEKEIQSEFDSFNRARKDNRRGPTNLQAQHLNHMGNKSINLTELFNMASLQNTESYRKTAKYTHEQPMLNVRRNSKVKQRPKCVSTFKLITIDEEAKSSSSLRRSSKVKIST